MVRSITALYFDSLSGDSEVTAVEVLLIAPDIIVENKYGGINNLGFRMINKVEHGQTEIKVDEAYSKVYSIEWPTEDTNIEWLAKATFLDVVRKLAD